MSRILDYIKKINILTSAVPFSERGGKVRGVVDLLTGCYPNFVFGGKLNGILPVFHFHEISPEELEAKLIFLKENGYKTLKSEDIHNFLKTKKTLGNNKVVLCFDDAWKSLWTVVFPLLKRFCFSAITYAIASKIVDAENLRKTIDDPTYNPDSEMENKTPFVTWPELKYMHDSGVIDVQCHTFSHSSVFCSNRIIDFVTPKYGSQPLLSRPLILKNQKDTFLSQLELGAPIYPQRSRMSDALRYYDDESIRIKCVDYVNKNGGNEFFLKRKWKEELFSMIGHAKGYFEKNYEKKAAIYKELESGRSILQERLRDNRIRHICFPWGIAGKIAIDAARKIGFKTAFSDHMFGRRAVRTTDNPFQLMRLKHNFIFCLPGRQRRFFILGR